MQAVRNNAGPGRPRSSEAGQAILGAVLELLAGAGYAAVTVQAIASRAGVSKATIYRRWPSKARLVVDALAESPPLRSRPRGELEGDLGALLREFLRIAAATPLGAALPGLLAERARDPELAEALDPLIRERTRPLQETFQRALARGELPPATDLELAVRVAIGPVLTRLLMSGGGSDARFVRDVVRTTVAGLRAAAQEE